jgi:hypothetical protein
MPLKIQDVYKQAGTQKIALIFDKDAKIYYLVLNTPFNMIDFEFIDLANQIID